MIWFASALHENESTALNDDFARHNMIKNDLIPKIKEIRSFYFIFNQIYKYYQKFGLWVVETRRIELLSESIDS